MTVTLTPGTASPLGSVTRPVTLPAGTGARAGRATSVSRSAADTQIRRGSLNVDDMERVHSIAAVSRIQIDLNRFEQSISASWRRGAGAAPPAHRLSGPALPRGGF